MHKPQNQISEIIAQFATTPHRLARAITGKTPEQLQQRFSLDTWSVSEIFAHMRSVDDIVGSRIYMLLARDTPPLIAFDERQWAEIARYANADFHQSLELFRLRRAEIVAVLQHLPAEAWQRFGLHEMHGEQSLFTIVQDIVAHEAEHCTQLEALFACEHAPTTPEIP